MFIPTRCFATLTGGPQRTAAAVVNLCQRRDAGRRRGAAAAQREQSEALLVRATQDAERYGQLYTSQMKAVSKAELDAADAGRASAVADLAARKDSVSAAKAQIAAATSARDVLKAQIDVLKVQLKEAEQQLAYNTIVAPVGGRVSGTTLHAVADAAEAAGSGRVRLTPHQKLLVLDVDPSASDELVATLDGIEAGEIDAREQPEDGLSFAPKITVDDARVDWSQPAIAVDHRVRACTPSPGAWTTYDEQRLKLGPVTHTDERLAPGQLRVGKTDVLVGTATTAVRLGEVKAFGSRQMPAADWARGLRLAGEAGRLA